MSSQVGAGPTGTEDDRRLTELLQRASEHLRGDKLDEAEREIAAALEMRPGDLRARNLRGLLLFRAARYDEARAVYVELAESHPDDAALLLNLGLVELRMGRHVEAVASLKRVVAAEPKNARAQGYYGLALMRSGDLYGAREAFRKGGQDELLRQVEERMAQSDEALAARGELRRAAQEGERVLAGEQPFGAVELEEPVAESRRSGSWQLRTAGELPPLPAPEGLAGDVEIAPLHLEPPRPVSAYATSRLLRPGATGDPFSISSGAEGGMLVLRIDGRLPTRTFGAIASTGNLTFEPLMRRVRGQASDEPFGDGAEAMFVAVGHGLMVVAPRGARFTALALAEDILYVREGNAFAFEESLHWENGRVPGAGADGQRVVQFRGHGRMVMRTSRNVYTLKVDPDSPLFVEAASLLGWIGRVVPRVLHGEGGAPSPYIEASGEGVLLLEEPPPLTVVPTGIALIE